MKINPKLLKSILIQLDKATPKRDSLVQIEAVPGSLTLTALRDPGLTKVMIELDHQESWACATQILPLKKLIARATSVDIQGDSISIDSTRIELTEYSADFPPFLGLPEAISLDGDKFSTALSKLTKLRGGDLNCRFALIPSPQGPRLTGYTPSRVTTALAGTSGEEFTPFTLPSNLSLPRAIGQMSVGLGQAYMEISFTAKLTGGTAKMTVIERLDGIDLPDTVTHISAGADNPVTTDGAQLRAGVSIAKAYGAELICLSYNPVRGMRLEIGDTDAGTFYHKVKAEGPAIWEVHLIRTNFEKIISGKSLDINVSTYEGLPIIRVTTDGVDQYLIGAKARKDPHTPLLKIKSFSVEDGGITLNNSANRIYLESLPGTGEMFLTHAELMLAKDTGRLESIAA